MTRVGFVINSRVPSRDAIQRGMPIYGMWLGWDDRSSPMSFMRFHWVADALRKSGAADYRLFRPGLPVDAVVFLKSMGPHCMELAETLREQGIRAIFEANVDYYNTCESQTMAMQNLVPNKGQHDDAVAITKFADGVIASSRHLANVCSEHNSVTHWIPDHVNLSLRPKRFARSPIRDGRLQVWWSGMASKALELLVAEAPMRAMKEKIHLHLVTDDLADRSKWLPTMSERFDKFLAEMPHTIHRFRDAKALLALYAEGGVIISPRTLDVPYNLSHTEWKITLGMACGMPAIASPVPSYEDVRADAAPGAVTICKSDEEWQAAFEKLLVASALRASGDAAREVVERSYSTEVVAAKHLEAVESILVGSGK